jgi:hypothetical protein
MIKNKKDVVKKMKNQERTNRGLKNVEAQCESVNRAPRLTSSRVICAEENSGHCVLFFGPKCFVCETSQPSIV